METKAPSPVTDALFFICEKCGKKLAGTDDPEMNPARKMQKSMKEKIKSRFGKGKMRPMISSCMDVCPKGEITVAIVRCDGRTTTPEFLTFKQEDLQDAEDYLIERTLR